MNRRSLLIRAAGLVAVAGGAWWARDHLFWPKPELVFGPDGATPWMPYGRPAPTPTVSVRIEGRDVLALIDSGAQFSVIDRAFFDTLPDEGRALFDMPLLAYGVGGGAQVGRGTSVNVDLPGLSVRKLRAAILDLGPLAAKDGLNTPLILGQDVLGEAVLALEPRRRHSRLVSREAFVLPPDLTPAEVRKQGTALQADLTVEGATVRAIIDTGASSLLGLSREAATTAGLLGGAMRSTIVEARTVTFADHLYEQVEIGVFDQPPLPNFPGGLVGMEAFRNRRVALDLGQGTMHLSRPLDLTVGLEN